MTKADLKSYKALCKERDRLAELIAGLEAALYGPKLPTLDGMPRSNPVEGSRLEKLVHKHIHLQQLYQKRLLSWISVWHILRNVLSHWSPLNARLFACTIFKGCLGKR